ncbi:MAG: 3'-5' exoribonuclease [Planctomycetes bacterium]|nr:3'-5' exoribonuclease [Planctomycetota bacterium]
MDRPLVVFDTETATCRGAPHLLEIGAIRVVDGEVVDHFESLARPEVVIEPEATAIHGITDEMVRDAPPTEAVLDSFLAWLGDDWMAAHNAEFDARVLGFECVRWRRAVPSGLIVDSLKLSRKLIREAPDHRLVTLCEHLELEEGTHHRALADATWCWKVIEECAARAKNGEPIGLAELVSLAGAPVTVERSKPRVARNLKPKHRPLADACDAREEVTLVYGEPPEPVLPLRVLPHFLYDLGDKSYLEAECRRSGTLKTYRLDRVQRVLA